MTWRPGEDVESKGTVYRRRVALDAEWFEKPSDVGRCAQAVLGYVNYERRLSRCQMA